MKNELRYKAKEIRKQIDVDNLSKKIQENLFSIPEYKKSKHILSYYSFSSEVCTKDYLKDKSKIWYLPRIEGNELVICPYNPFELCKNKYNIFEPSGECIKDISIIDMIIIPCLCADRNGYRLGYGKGYYDRFLKRVKHHPFKIILTFEELLFDDINPESWDESCNIIITEKKIYRI